MKRPIVQAVIFVLLAAVVAVVANGFAGRERRLTLPGFYPNALRVPEKPSPAPPAAAAPVPTTTVPVPQPVVTAATETMAAVIAPKAAAPAPKPVAPPAVPIAQRFPPHPDKAYVEISGSDVAALHAAGVLFLDARRTSVYEEGHIAGARPFSVWEADVDEKVNKLFEERSDPEQQNQPIVIYCSGGACEDSHMLAEKLWGIQFNNVYVYKDGYPDWLKRNGPVRQGATP